MLTGPRGCWLRPDCSTASYRVTDDLEEEPHTWLQAADVKRGSWWPDYGDWLAERASDLKPAPKTLGSRTHRASAKAPGSYVHANCWLG